MKEYGRHHFIEGDRHVSKIMDISIGLIGKYRNCVENYKRPHKYHYKDLMIAVELSNLYNETNYLNFCLFKANWILFRTSAGNSKKDGFESS